MKQRGFTLVELLVVVAIIALLISILAPSLKAAKDLAKEMLCMTNQRALGTALSIYAEVNRGYILPYRMDKPAELPGLPSGMCLAFQGVTAVDPVDGLIDKGNRRTFGWAYSMGVWPNPDMFYCPLLPQAGLSWSSAKSYPQPWGTKPPPAGFGTAHVRVNYIYNPHCDGAKYFYGLQLAAFPSNRPLLCDLFYADFMWGHTFSGTKWFMVYPDHHVAPTVASKAAMDIADNLDAYSEGGRTTLPWTDYPVLYGKIFN
jgi:prepilin-type N-terminal cleavage/methylation domain-containing protein